MLVKGATGVSSATSFEDQMTTPQAALNLRMRCTDMNGGAGLLRYSSIYWKRESSWWQFCRHWRPQKLLRHSSVPPMAYSATSDMGFLPDTKICGLHMRRECRKRFPRHRLQRKPIISDPGMHHDTCVTYPGWLTCGLPIQIQTWQGKRSRHSRCIRNLQFHVSGKRPMKIGIMTPLYFHIHHEISWQVTQPRDWSWKCLSPLWKQAGARTAVAGQQYTTDTLSKFEKQWEN